MPLAYGHYNKPIGVRLQPAFSCPVQHTTIRFLCPSVQEDVFLAYDQSLCSLKQYNVTCCLFITADKGTQVV